MAFVFWLCSIISFFFWKFIFFIYFKMSEPFFLLTQIVCAFVSKKKKIYQLRVFYVGRCNLILVPQYLVVAFVFYFFFSFYIFWWLLICLYAAGPNNGLVFSKTYWKVKLVLVFLIFLYITYTYMYIIYLFLIIKCWFSLTHYFHKDVLPFQCHF